MIYLFTDRLFFRLYEAYAFLIEQGIIYVLKKKENPIHKSTFK